MDQKLLFLINRAWTSPALDRLMAVFSSLDLWLPLLLLGGVALAVWGGFRGRAFLVAAIACTAVSDGLIGNSLKHLVNRPRPAQVVAPVRQVDLAKARPRFLALFLKVRAIQTRVPSDDGRGRSFPSSHTANTMAAAVIAAFFFPRRGWLALLPALLVAYSRIYTGSHWPSDVAASLFLGAGLGLLSVAAAELAWHRGARRWWPEALRRHPSLLTA